MAAYYIAGIVPEAEGGFSVYFPDVTNVAASGETIEEAITNASNGLIVALRGMIELGSEAPHASSLNEVIDMVKKEREADELPYPEDTIYQYIAAPALDMVPVRVSISIPRSTLEEIDEKAKRAGFTRSGFLAHAALKYRA